jgi:hypothetical protein
MLQILALYLYHRHEAERFEGVSANTRFAAAKCERRLKNLAAISTRDAAGGGCTGRTHSGRLANLDAGFGSIIDDKAANDAVRLT